MSAGEVLCVGEIVWDELPSGRFLGGAPLNVAYHLRTLGVPAVPVSAVGADRAGAEALERIRRLGLPTELVRVHPSLPTGTARAALDAHGQARFTLPMPVAWDDLRCDEALVARAAGARAVVFGTLAQRAPGSRATIRHLADRVPWRVLDLNLRPPHDDPEVVTGALARADVLKANRDELTWLATRLGWPESDEQLLACRLAERFGIGTVCVTRGAEGAALWREGRWTERPGVAVAVADTVGAGDAFLAALVAGLFAGYTDGRLLEAANRLGAHVAAQPGATPPAPTGFGL